MAPVAGVDAGAVVVAAAAWVAGTIFQPATAAATLKNVLRLLLDSVVVPCGAAGGVSAALTK